MLPSAFRAERLRRDDDAYDAIVVIGHNDAPPVSGEGSAIFLHIREGDTTAGCIAIDHDSMRSILAHVGPVSSIEIAEFEADRE